MLVLYLDGVWFLYPAEMSFHTNALLSIAALRQMIGRQWHIDYWPLMLVKRQQLLRYNSTILAFYNTWPKEDYLQSYIQKYSTWVLRGSWQGGNIKEDMQVSLSMDSPLVRLQRGNLPWREKNITQIQKYKGIWACEIKSKNTQHKKLNTKSGTVKQWRAEKKQDTDGNHENTGRNIQMHSAF